MDAMSRWVELATDWCRKPGVEPGTMMGFPCLRFQGAFMACMHRDATHLIVKLPATRVAALVAQQHGEAFAPAGKVFKEWLAVPVSLEHTFDARMQEAWDFARN